MTEVLVGIDVGTSGVRVVAAGPSGEVLAEAAEPLASSRPAPGTHEQAPAEWWRAVCRASGAVAAALGGAEVAGVAVTSTSGSLVVTDAQGRPLRPAILYDDGRAAGGARALGALSGPDEPAWNASYSLAKAVWLRECEPAVWAAVRHLLHPADWLAGKLTGEFGVSDFSNSLKLGYDPGTGSWSPAVAQSGIRRELLPSVARPGEAVGVMCGQAARETGFPPGVPVLAGATDGMASLIASGASRPGDANTTLGTTLVWKALAMRRPPAARGVYSHLYPSGLWAAGAASNTGPGSVETAAALDGAAAGCLPSRLLCYPLTGHGERFPFLSGDAAAFREGPTGDAAEWHAAQLQALAFVERWGYEVLAECGVEPAGAVYSAGGAAASAVLSQLRANVLGRRVLRCCHPTAAFGAAILAATGTVFAGDVGAAVSSMTRVAAEHAPLPEMVERYDALYRRFRACCHGRGYC